MSHYPPYGPPHHPPPPPYYGHHPPPPPLHHHHLPPPFPPIHHPHHPPPPHAPYMPIPSAPYPHQPENTTYITNYYVQPDSAPEAVPVAVVDQPQIASNNYADSIDWVPATGLTAQSFAARAVVAGHEAWDGSPLWVIRSHHNGELIPGKLAVKHRSAYIPNASRELPVHNFEIMCANPEVVRWLPASNGQVPIGAIVAGNTLTGEPLYVGRVRHAGSLTPGKVHPSHQCCYISYSGKEVAIKFYEVLCKKIG